MRNRKSPRNAEVRSVHGIFTIFLPKTVAFRRKNVYTFGKVRIVRRDTARDIRTAVRPQLLIFPKTDPGFPMISGINRDAGKYDIRRKDCFFP